MSSSSFSSSSSSLTIAQQSTIINQFIKQWIKIIHTHDKEQIYEILADEPALEFHSPVVHTVYRKKSVIHFILTSIMTVIIDLHYTNIYTTMHVDDMTSVKEAVKASPPLITLKQPSAHIGVAMVFRGRVKNEKGEELNIEGIDLFELNEKGKIVSMRVMMRPLQAYLAMANAMKNLFIASGQVSADHQKKPFTAKL